ncbi:MAG: amidohydrolase family protein [Candidatus Binatia bacterium]|nr:amidohydrolase family protein [Candidatus Binatia bacterium]MDG2008625.1 amidohydrolase family protein [Candidatus Binatia bacterium]
MHDLVIRRGKVVDGSGAPAVDADIAIDGETIVAVGEVTSPGKIEIDADGDLVTPGFVDVHTHYDGQVTWDPELRPSSFHGVTTVVMGNCGVGFAPCAPDRRDWLIGLMEGVEDIPGTALAAGIRWNWETFPEFMDAVEASPLAMDVGVQVPHGALRAYVMGDRGAELAKATPAEIEEMSALVCEAVEAGALGFTTSRTEKHRDKAGQPTPSFGVAGEELQGIARAMGKTGKGVLQLIADFHDFEPEFAMIRGMAEVSGRPLSMTIEQDDRHPEIWKNVLEGIAAAARDGLPMRGQVPARATGVVMGLDVTLHPFLLHQTFYELADKPLAERAAALRDPEFRSRLLAETVEIDPSTIVGVLFGSFGKMFRLNDPPDYEPHPSTSAAAEATRRGVTPQEVLLDWLSEEDGNALLYFPLMNYLDGDLEMVREMLTHPQASFGLSDAGAHCGTVCDGSFPTTMLTHWVRDRARGEKLPLEWVIQKLTRGGADLVGLKDRGLLAPGMKADVNVIDFDALALHAPQVVRDLPANGRRLLQRASGYRYSVISGEVAFIDGEGTGTRRGRLLRGARPDPRA